MLASWQRIKTSHKMPEIQAKSLFTASAHAANPAPKQIERITIPNSGTMKIIASRSPIPPLRRKLLRSIRHRSHAITRNCERV